MKRSRTPQYLTPEELTRLFRAIDSTRDIAIFRLAYHRGLRATEVGMLQVEDYRRDAGRLHVHRLKNGHSGEYVLTDIERRTLNAWLKERGEAEGAIFISNRRTPISQQMLDVLMKRYGASARLPASKRHFHCLRHSCATSLLENGQDIAIVQDHLGHANIQNTMVYAKITNKRRDQAGVAMKGWN
jgi:integrase